jgi:4-oxalocrotonate tautomerase
VQLFGVCRFELFLRTETMPLIQVTMLQGRTADQKRKLAQRITDAMVEEAGARREAIVVTFVEVSTESYASGGVLMVDKGK